MNPMYDIKLNDPLRTEESERAFLGTILVNPALLLGFKKLKPYMFSNSTFKKIAIKVFDFVKEKQTIEIPILADELNFPNALDLLFGLIKHSDSFNVKAYSKRIIEKYVSRQEITLSQKAINKIRMGENAIQVQNEIQRERDAIHEALEGHEESRLKEFTKVMDSVRKANEGDDMTFGISTGYAIFDEYFSGWQKGNEIVLAGRPGQGKTSLALCILLILAMMGNEVAFVSVEMPKRQIMLKLVSILTGLSVQDILGSLNKTQQEEVDKAFMFLYELPFWIITGCKSVNDIVDSVRLLNAKVDLEMVSIDYIQKIKGQTGISRNYQIEEINQTLIDLCGEKDCDCALIALAQLGREVDKRADKMPKLTDLKDSGSLEQDAFAVIFIYRPEYYGIKKHPRTNEDLTGVVYLKVAKNRLGKTGTFRFSFDAHSGTFLEGLPEIDKENMFLKYPAKGLEAF